MINTNIKLVILLMDETTFKYDILSTSEHHIELPSINVIEFLDLDSAIQLSLSNYLMDIKNNTIYPYKFSDIHITDSLDLYFFTIINHSPSIQTGYRISINKYECHLPNLAKVLQRLQG